MLVILNASAATERRASLYDDIEDESGAELKEPTAKQGERTAFWGVPRAPMRLAVSRLSRDADGGDSHFWVLVFRVRLT